MATRKILPKDEQLLMKLESILDLYKNFHDAADEQDKLVVLEALEDIREILTRTYITERLKSKELTEIETVLKDLNSHVKAMALDELFSEVNEMKMRMDLVEARFELEDTITHPKNYFNEEDEDDIWSRISAKRKEILGQSSLRLRTLLPRYMHKVRFDLPGLPAHVRTGSDAGNENESSQDTSEGTKELVKSTDQLLQDSVNSLQGLMKERRTRLRAARRPTKISSGLASSADYSIRRSKLGLERARDALCGKLNTTATSSSDDHSQEKPKSEIIVRCEECQKLLKERDKFWGLESDSEEENIKEFNEHVRRRSLRRDSRIFEAAEGKVVDMSSRALSHKEVRGIAGRGTWTSPAYAPLWAVNDVDRTRANSMTDPFVFGHKKGILKKFLSRLTRHHPSS
ncbi:uncharacterized protein LOC144638210 [Oculina patagonica]